MSSRKIPAQVSIFEVGARDGLQNEPELVPLATKTWFIENLVRCGFHDIEIGAFVNPEKVPQMADTATLYSKIKKGELPLKKSRPWSLVPNAKGLEIALQAGAKNIAVFTASTDGFNLANIGMTVNESLKQYAPVIAKAKKNRLRVRAYVSTAFGCPFEGAVPPSKPLRVTEKLLELGADQVSIGDTIGVAVPQGRGGVTEVARPALQRWGANHIALHFHDTRGTALANALRALELGAKVFDSSAGGLGGCPFAPGATGNLATEDLVYMLHQMGVRTGIDLDLLCRISAEMSRRMNRPITSRYVTACLRSRGTVVQKKRTQR